MFFLFVLLCIALCQFWFYYHLEEEKRFTGCFAVVVLEMNCYYKCSVAPPNGAVGWAAVSDCVFPDHIHVLFGLQCVFFQMIQD